MRGGEPYVGMTFTLADHKFQLPRILEHKNNQTTITEATIHTMDIFTNKYLYLPQVHLPTQVYQLHSPVSYFTPQTTMGYTCILRYNTYSIASTPGSLVSLRKEGARYSMSREMSPHIIQR